MLNRVNILGVDPGFAKTGWAVLSVGEGADVLEAMGVIQTDKESRKRNAYESADSFERARTIAKELTKILAQFQPKIICFEAQSPVRNANVAAKLGMSYGVLATIAYSYGMPVVAPTPQKVKKLTVGKITASKEEIAEFVAGKFSASPVYKEFLKKARKADLPHPQDAIAVVYASGDSEAVRMLRKLA